MSFPRIATLTWWKGLCVPVIPKVSHSGAFYSSLSCLKVRFQTKCDPNGHKLNKIIFQHNYGVCLS